jgi:hypothetical protein
MATDSFFKAVIIDEDCADSFIKILTEENDIKVNLKTSEKVERFKYWSELMKKEVYNVKKETEDMMNKVNQLNDFMRTKDFYKLPRVEKDLYYDLFHNLVSALQLLGKIAENKNVSLNIK